MDVDADVADRFHDDVSYDDVPLAALGRIYPGCLLVDARKLDGGLWDVGMEGVFVYPSYDEAGKQAILLCVGFDGYWDEPPYESRVILKGSTFGEARQATEAAWRRRLSLLDCGLGKEHVNSYFSVYDDTLGLANLVIRLLSLVCSGDVRITETYRDGVLNLDLMLANEGEDNEPATDAAVPNEGPEGSGVPCEPPGPEEEADDLEGDVSPDEGDAGEDAAAGNDAEEEPGDERAEKPATLPSQDGEVRSGLLETERLRQEIEGLRAAMEAEKAAFSYHLQQAQRSASMMQEENAALKGRATLIEELVLPATPLEALQLAARAFPDRLVVVKRAEKSARLFTKGSTGEVWNVLRSMSVVLHPLLFDDDTGDIAAEFEAKAGFELALREVKQAKRNPDMAKARQIVYKGEERDIAPHVKGRSRKPGETLRVHFFADCEEEKIVIAYCGEHMETVKTSSL